MKIITKKENPKIISFVGSFMVGIGLTVIMDYIQPANTILIIPIGLLISILGFGLASIYYQKLKEVDD